MSDTFDKLFASAKQTHIQKHGVLEADVEGLLRERSLRIAKVCDDATAKDMGIDEYFAAGGTF